MVNLTQGINIGYVVFSGFTSLDVWGPLQVLNMVSNRQPMTLSLISETLDPVLVDRSPWMWATRNQTSRNFYQELLPTHTLETAPIDLDVIIVPGGGETRNIEGTQSYVDFLRKRWSVTSDSQPSDSNGVAIKPLSYIMSVCTGSSLLARTGLLDGLNATTNKAAWQFVTGPAPKVNWHGKARWVVDGNVWTSAGVSAGTDMFLGWISELYGEAEAKITNRAMEWNRSFQDDDPWAAEYGLE